ncbi:ribonuclease HIII [candidate division KSB1 bacterium]|nr:ribonuclease HIII [candidate division KSB1 bacterium]
MTLIIPRNKFDSLKAFLEKNGYSLEDRPHQFFLARNKGLVLNLYENGKIVFQGNNEPEKIAIMDFLKSIDAEEAVKAETKYPLLEIRETRIGTDEAGKGDYFGPLVIAGVLASERQIKIFEEVGVKDSKNLSDSSIRDYAKKIKDFLGKDQFSIIAIKPAKYNQLHESMKNVNRILAWGHARAIENLLEKNTDCHLAIADQFGDQRFIEDALMKHGRNIKIIQTPKAERELSVAAASILARNEFVRAMDLMGKNYGMSFPKGATNVIAAAEKFVGKFGSNELNEVVKIHFKTTKQISNL